MEDKNAALNLYIGFLAGAAALLAWKTYRDFQQQLFAVEMVSTSNSRIVIDGGQPSARVVSVQEAFGIIDERIEGIIEGRIAARAPAKAEG